MRSIISVCVMLLLFGCTTSKVTSNKDPEFSKKISKMHIIIHGSANSDVYLLTLADYLRDELNKKGVKATVEKPNPLSLESEKEMLDRISKLQPDVLMVINQTEARRTSGNYSLTGVTTGATLDIKLFQPSADKPVWRANCDGDSQFGQGPAGKKSGQRIIEKMIADQLIQ